MFSIGKELSESNYDFSKIMINTICNTTFFDYKIFNLITNFIKQSMIK